MQLDTRLNKEKVREYIHTTIKWYKIQNYYGKIEGMMKDLKSIDHHLTESALTRLFLRCYRYKSKPNWENVIGQSDKIVQWKSVYSTWIFEQPLISEDRNEEIGKVVGVVMSREQTEKTTVSEAQVEKITVAEEQEQTRVEEE